MLRKRLEGQLLKFTNVVKGYQYRWCIVDPDSGTIEYYEKEDHKRSSKPRGTLNLTYASVCPSDEDSQAFVINAANGDFLRLKAADAKERQFWVNRIRAIAEFHSDRAAHNPLIATISETCSSDSSTGRINVSHGSGTTTSSFSNRKFVVTDGPKTTSASQQTVLLPPTDAIVSEYVHVQLEVIFVLY
ncbi:putative oxysterol-binding protein [Fasciola gigantica]|uniref:Putative oxysterol-binding protein n=1 Tax=Fasciola gigantica TaxID=46835 RepID=A0A504Z0V8_FASGI|nr:putative oxysterol-binding protein [Fasciola gigantica]